MPLDPNISLNIQPIQPVDLTKIQQLRLLMGQEELQRQQVLQSMTQQQLGQAQIEEARARLPGVQATAEVLVRDAAFNKFLGTNAKEFLTPSGSYNTPKLIELGIGAGFYDKIQPLVANDRMDALRQITNATNEQSRAAAEANFVGGALTHAAAIAHSMPADKQLDAINSYASMMNQIYPKSGDYVRSQFIKTDPKTGMDMVDKDKVAATRTATISAQNQEDMAFRFAQNFFTAEGRNPNSQISKDFRRFAAEQSGRPGLIPEGTSYFDALNNPLYKDVALQFIQSAQVPQATRAAALEAGSAIASTVTNYDNAITSLNKVSSKVLSTRPGAIGSAAFARFVLTDPNLAGLDTAVQVHNNQFPNDPIDTNKLTVGEIRAKLKAGREQLKAIGEGKSTLSTTQRLPSGTVPVEERIGILRSELNKAIAAKDAVAIDSIQKELKALGTKGEAAIAETKPVETKSNIVPRAEVEAYAKEKGVSVNVVIKALADKGIKVQ